MKRVMMELLPTPWSPRKTVRMRFMILLFALVVGPLVRLSGGGRWPCPSARHVSPSPPTSPRKGCMPCAACSIPITIFTTPPPLIILSPNGVYTQPTELVLGQGGDLGKGCGRCRRLDWGRRGGRHAACCLPAPPAWCLPPACLLPLDCLACLGSCAWAPSSALSRRPKQRNISQSIVVHSCVELTGGLGFVCWGRGGGLEPDAFHPWASTPPSPSNL
jgi:hypothetical protein